MRYLWWVLPCAYALCVLAAPGGENVVGQADRDGEPFVRMNAKTVDQGLKVGYAVVLVDVDDDGKKDIVVVDTTRVVWFQNPTWKQRVIISNQTKPDNVCIAAHDIDGDGKVDFALGAEWRPFFTKGGGTIQWLKRGKSLDEKWSVIHIAEEPTVHRMQFADVTGDGKPELIVVPLMGKGSTAKNNWMDGSPVRTLAFAIPKDPATDRWVPEVLDQSLHVVHNFAPVPAKNGKGMDILAASYEGVSWITRVGDSKWKSERIGAGNQENPKGNRGASEIALGKLKDGHKFIVTVEPWHGNQIVVYTPPAKLSDLWQRHVIDQRLRWGHAVWCADLDGDGGDELIVGVRDDPTGADRFSDRRGVRVYKAADAKGTQWKRQIIDNGDMACEALAVDDLDGDGRNDIVAVGRQTHNVKIYWNATKRPKAE